MTAYELDKALDLHLVPASVERTVNGRPASVIWWVDDGAMTESPNGFLTPFDASWVELLITRAWRIWLIDHTETFRVRKQLEHPPSLTRCDRVLPRKLGEMHEEVFLQKLGKYLSADHPDRPGSPPEAVRLHGGSLSPAQCYNPPQATPDRP